MDIQQYEATQLPAPPFLSYAPWAGPSDINTVIQFMIPVIVLAGILGVIFIGIKGLATR